MCQTCLDHAETEERRQLREESDDDHGPISFIAQSGDIATKDSPTPLCSEPSQPSSSQANKNTFQYLSDYQHVSIDDNAG